MIQHQLIEACKNKDRRAQMKLYNQYCQGMHYVALRFLKDPYEAEDAMQEAFIKAFAKLQQFTGEVTFGAWLKRIVINKCIDKLKAKKLELVAINEQVLSTAEEDDNWQVDDGIGMVEIKQSIEKLPEKYKYPLMLFLMEGYDHEEISEILKITPVASRTLVHRGKKKLQEELKTIKMAQDIREMFKNDKEPKPNNLPKGHQMRFEERLEKEFPSERKNNAFFFIKIAAVLVVALGVGFFFLNSGGDNFNNEPSVADAPTEFSEEKEDTLTPTENNFQLSEVSPEFKKIEDYYMASLNIELSKINITPKNKALIDSFMNQMSELDKEYQRLNTEIKEAGPNEQTLEAMIANLQLRLDLLYKLKNKLKEINQSKDKEYENYEV